MTRNSDRDSIQVLARAAAVLRIVAGEQGGMGLSEIARRTGLARSTIQRIVKSLEDEAFLAPAPGRSGYALGPGLHALLGSAPVDVATLAEPFLRELALAVDETVDLSILQGTRALFVSHIAGNQRLSAISAVGTQFPLHSTANGKALLACLTPAQRDKVLPQVLSADTSRTVTDRMSVLQQVAEVLLSGVSYDNEEHTEGVCAIGTAFLDALGQPHAISIPVPRARFFKHEADLKSPLLHCCKQIVEAINGRGMSG